MENAIARHLDAGDVPRALGSRHPLIAPFQSFPTADKPIAVCVDTNEQWERLVGAMGLPHLPADPRFLTGSLRNAHHAELEPLLVPVFAGRSRDERLGEHTDAILAELGFAAADIEALRSAAVVRGWAGGRRRKGPATGRVR